MVSFIKLILFMLLAAHIIACCWVLVGRLSDAGWVITSDRNDDLFAYELYTESFYFVLTTITTVGYGDISGKTRDEYIFSMVIEFVGLTFFSFLMGTVSMMFSGDSSFEALINERLEDLDLWMRKLEICNKKETLPISLFTDIKKNISAGIVHDFNLIQDEFEYFEQLPAHL